MKDVNTIARHSCDPFDFATNLEREFPDMHPELRRLYVNHYIDKYGLTHVPDDHDAVPLMFVGVVGVLGLCVVLGLLFGWTAAILAGMISFSTIIFTIGFDKWMETRE